MIQYLLTVSTCWIAFYAIFHLFLKKETFFGSNRGYLLFSLGAGLLIPAYQWIPSSWYSNPEPIQALMYYQDDIITITNSGPSSSNSLSDYVILIYWMVVILMLTKLGVGLLKIFRLYRGGEKVSMNGLNVVHTKGIHLPFSFMKTVYISKALPLKEEIDSIFNHEKVHVDSWHTLDVLFIEFLHVFFWFNPILIFYKKSLQQLHEYAADASVIKDTISRKSYGQLLLRHSQSGLEIALANHFFQSQIKKRISMMYKEKSSRSALVKYLAVIPVFLLLLLVFSSHTTNPTLSEETQEQLNPNTQKVSFQIDSTKLGMINLGKSVPQGSVRVSSGETLLIENQDYEIDYAQGLLKITNQAYLSEPINVSFENSATLAPSEFDHSESIFYKKDEEGEEVQFNFEGKGLVAIKYQKKGDKVSYAEVVPEKSEIKDKLTLKRALKAFYTLPIPPPPPAPPTALSAPEAPSSPRAPKSIVPPPPPPPPGAPECNDMFKVVEQMPRFSGCEHLANEGKSAAEIERCAKQKMLGYIYQNLKYPSSAREAGIEGTVVIQFVVNKDGNVDRIKLLRDPGAGLGTEGLRVVNAFNDVDGRWVPGKHKGKKVNVVYTLPIKFKLEGNGENTDKVISVEGVQNQIDLNTGQDPLFIIDGKEVKKDISNNLDPNDIATINVYKGEKAIAMFGAKAANGVVDIVTKVNGTVKEEPYAVVEEMPRFPGCEDIKDKRERHDCSRQKLLTYIYENVTYPEAAKEAGTEGTSVVQFTIKKTGIIDDIKILRDPGNGLGQEATNVVELMQDEITWIPGTQSGKRVNVKYTLPIKFKLKGEAKNESRSLELNNLNVSPNPTTGRFRLKFEGEAGPIRIDIRDMAGNLLHQVDSENFNGAFNEEIAHPSFVNKAAIVTIIQGEKSTSKKIVFK